MENIKFIKQCEEWIIKPDYILPDSNPEFEEKHFTCKCSLCVCGWRKGRINKTRNRIVYKIRKLAWPQVIKLARALNIEIE
jgi:hypothetical protein